MTNLPQPRPSGLGPLAREQRIGHAERERACDLLAESYGDGRLSHDEFEQRTELAMRAQTNRQLAVLLADLPGASVARPTNGVAAGWIILEALVGVGFLLGAALLFALAMIALVAGSGGWWVVLLFSLLSLAGGGAGIGLAVRHTRQRRQ